MAPCKRRLAGLKVGAGSRRRAAAAVQRRLPPAYGGAFSISGDHEEQHKPPGSAAPGETGARHRPVRACAHLGPRRCLIRLFETIAGQAARQRRCSSRHTGERSLERPLRALSHQMNCTRRSRSTKHLNTARQHRHRLCYSCPPLCRRRHAEAASARRWSPGDVEALGCVDSAHTLTILHPCHHASPGELCAGPLQGAGAAPGAAAAASPSSAGCWLPAPQPPAAPGPGHASAQGGVRNV